MKCGTVATLSTGAGLGCAVTLGALGAGFGAANGAIGAAVLNASGYEGFSCLEATQMGALGAAILDAALGCCVGMLGGCFWGILKNWVVDDSDEELSNNSGNCISNLVSYVASSVIGGLIGYAILNLGADERVMGLGETAAALAVGSAITFCPQYLVSLCVAVPLASFVRTSMALNDDDDGLESDDLSTAERGNMHKMFTPRPARESSNATTASENDASNSSGSEYSGSACSL